MESDSRAGRDSQCDPQTEGALTQPASNGRKLASGPEAGWCATTPSRTNDHQLTVFASMLGGGKERAVGLSGIKEALAAPKGNVRLYANILACQRVEEA